MHLGHRLEVPHVQPVDPQCRLADGHRGLDPLAVLAILVTTVLHVGERALRDKEHRSALHVAMEDIVAPRHLEARQGWQHRLDEVHVHLMDPVEDRVAIQVALDALEFDLVAHLVGQQLQQKHITFLQDVLLPAVLMLNMADDPHGHIVADPPLLQVPPKLPELAGLLGYEVPQLGHQVCQAAEEGRERNESGEQHQHIEQPLREVVRVQIRRALHLRHRPVQGRGVLLVQGDMRLVQAEDRDPSVLAGAADAVPHTRNDMEAHGQHDDLEDDGQLDRYGLR
mmetsp:Transcript_95053/g.273621  ORF Transcript_95053/g.273621 Transcript_95053/m.273621 type:complete len:282 (-) Transcript_95053:1081-1926(-)